MGTTEAWLLEGATIGEGDEVTNSLADRINTIQAAVSGMTPGDLAAIKAVTDALPDAGALTTLQGDVTDIKAVTDVLPDAGALTTLTGYAKKIDAEATLGLLGTSNSLSYRVHEIERHFHSNERWASKLAVPAGNRVTEVGMTPFIAASGNNAYGVAVQIMDTADAVGLFPGAVKYDLHRLFISDLDNTTTYRIRVSYGSGTQPAAVAAGQYSELMWRSDNVNSDRTPITIQMRRIDAAYKAWVEVWNVNNLSEVDFFVGIHFYEG